MPAPNLVDIKKKTRTKAIILYSIGGILLFFLLFFIGYVLYFMWQFRFGDPETLQRLEQSLRPPQFTQVDARSRDSEQVDHFETYIRKHNPILGSSDAPVKIIAFIDFECPFCQRSYPITKDVVQQFSGAVQFVFKHLPLSSIHPQAHDAAIASSCAHDQNKFWDYYDALFESKKIDADSLIIAAQHVGMNTTAFETCMQRNPNGSQIQQDTLDAVDVGVRGTPTYLLNGRILEGVITKEQWKEYILEELQG